MAGQSNAESAETKGKTSCHIYDAEAKPPVTHKAKMKASLKSALCHCWPCLFTRQQPNPCLRGWCPAPVVYCGGTCPWMSELIQRSTKYSISLISPSLHGEIVPKTFFLSSRKGFQVG